MILSFVGSAKETSTVINVTNALHVMAQNFVHLLFPYFELSLRYSHADIELILSSFHKFYQKSVVFRRKLSWI